MYLIKQTETFSKWLLKLKDIKGAIVDYTKAIKAYEKGLIAAEQMGDKLTLGYNFNAIGNIYKDQGEDNKALEYYEKSLLIHQEINDKQGIADVNANIEMYFQRNKNLQQSKAHNLLFLIF